MVVQYQWVTLKLVTCYSTDTVAEESVTLLSTWVADRLSTHQTREQVSQSVEWDHHVQLDVLSDSKKLNTNKELEL